jgi:hypothetical protein
VKTGVVTQLGADAGRERRSRRAAATPRAWSGRGIVHLQPKRPCRRCLALRNGLIRIGAFLGAAMFGVIVYAEAARLAHHLIVRG